MQYQVRSKPLIGFLGFFTSVLAVLAGFGLACYLGVRFTMMMNSGVGEAIAIIAMITDISGILTHYKWKSKTFPVRS